MNAAARRFLDPAQARGLKRGFLALAALYAVSLAIIGSPWIDRDPELIGMGVTLDLTFTATGLFWFLVVRPGHARLAMLVPVFATGLATAKVFLPDGGRAALAYLAGAWVVVEVAVMALVVTRLRNSPESRLRAVVVTEVRLVAAAFGGWFWRAPAAATGAFSVHRRSSWSVVAATLAFLLAVETAALHLALMRLSPVVAWIATASSIYALLWVAADAHALRRARVRVDGEAIHLDLGLRWQAEIPRALVESATRVDERLKKAPDLLRAELLWPTVLLTLRAPVRVRGPYGFDRRVSRVSLSVDDAEGFVAAVRSA